MLIASSPDKVAFTQEVWKRVEQVTNKMVAKRGVLVIPPNIVEAMKRCRPMAYRHARGDLRHSESEMRYEQELANWLVEQWAELQGLSKPDVRFGPHR